VYGEDWIRYGIWLAGMVGVGGAAWWLARVRQGRSRQRLERAERQARALVEISAGASWAGKDLAGLFTTITEIAARAFDGGRVGAWLLSDDGQELRCADLYDAGRKVHSVGPTFTLAAHSRYFEALRAGWTIDAADARWDPRTSALRSDYLEPQGITSTLDAPVRASGRLVGVVRYEQTGPRRTWREDEVSFLGAVAGQVAQAVLDARRTRAEERFRLVVEAAPYAMIMADAGGRIALVNGQAEVVFGYGREEMLGRPVETLVPEQRRAHFAQARAGGGGTGLELVGLRRDGTEVPIEVGLNPIPTPEGDFVLACVMDVTERKRAEARAVRERNELAHLSRVTMLGELSGSLAHELNQPLTSILSNAQAAQRMLAGAGAGADGDLQEVREILADIVSEDKRAGEVIQRLRQLLRKGDPVQQELDLNELVRDVLKIVRSDLVHHGVDVETRLAPSLPPVTGDRVQLEQVLLNLIVNGCDAMSENRKLDRRLVVSSEARENDGVCVCVADQGSGIPAGRANRIFEPFYTTKANGMGLGLTICRSIVAAHGGSLRASNNDAGPGASFHISLPKSSGGAT
jgi:PAS domain S-box-containing protein